jgi:hypothetical protein
VCRPGNVHSLSARVSKPLAAGQLWPAACFCIAGWLKMVLKFSNDWKKTQKILIIILGCIKITQHSKFNVHKYILLEQL